MFYVIDFGVCEKSSPNGIHSLHKAETRPKCPTGFGNIIVKLQFIPCLCDYLNTKSEFEPVADPGFPVGVRKPLMMTAPSGSANVNKQTLQG